MVRRSAAPVRGPMLFGFWLVAALASAVPKSTMEGMREILSRKLALRESSRLRRRWRRAAA
eukprot:CAMPEP_0177670624 /NCGR_PEP_ID=MMETSP0447-20121125/24197_1 /TAXON_ID=0 /ORGANISM="Stygamoeba regulata, Strain BSH-02190019" /LENGTH=60 /DNA_ID=CAMNT_0019177817 /DNA_START=212 /DNA_END=391 /DNA_ORIENTATION=+